MLEVSSLNKTYADTKILNDISFTVNDGEFLSFLGPSGCGKTTVLRIITGLEHPDSGKITINGQDISGIPTEKRNIGMVFQNYALFPHMNVFGNVAYGLKIRRMSKEQISGKVEWALNLVRMPGMQSRKITELSGGQQQRIALARALVIEPDILLLDEPLSALDKKIRTEMQEEIRSIQKKLGITTIFVTHDQEEAMSMSDRIILMNNGTIEQEAEPRTLYNKPASVFASNFLGKANAFAGTILKRGDNFVFEGDNFEFDIIAPKGAKDNSPATAVIRGENFMVSPDEKPGFRKAEVIGTIFSGTLCKLIVKLGGSSADVVLMSTDAKNINQGDTVNIGVKPENITVFPGHA